MSEPTLSLSYDDIRQRVGLERGFGPTIANWSTEQADLVEHFLKDGANNFYVGASYEWSFLKPITTITIPEGEDDFPLPSDFGFLMGKIYFASGQNWGEPLKVENVAKVLMRADESTGRPIYAAIAPIKPGAGTGHRQRMVVWPIPDDSYVVKLQYSVLPDALSTSNPYPYGGAAHARTILEACLMASENFDRKIDIHSQLYTQALAASISYDRRVKAQTLSELGTIRTAAHSDQGTVTYIPSS